MELTYRQQEGLKIAVERYRQKEKFTVISGYAGSGKSTLVRFIIDALQIDEKNVCYCAFTGKAAQVLINKGNKNAITAHKLLYKSTPTPDGGFIHSPKPVLEYKVVVVDECSMLPKEMMRQLLSYHGIYVIFCGDPGQLPPVSRENDNHLLDHPHVFLDEIMRQAQDSGIIQLSMLIREGKSIDNFKTSEAIVLPKKELSTGMMTWSDIILCGTNNTRNSLNKQMRECLGKTGLIDANEKLINTKNDWDYLSIDHNALTNGCIGYLKDSYESFVNMPPYARVIGGKVNIITGRFITETGDDFGSIMIDKKFLETGESALSEKQKYIIAKNFRFKRLIPHEFAYGYAITCHKSQGSSWPNVLVTEERFPFDKEEHKKWLYTACTRAESRVVILR